MKDKHQELRDKLIDILVDEFQNSKHRVVISDGGAMIISNDYKSLVNIAVDKILETVAKAMPEKRNKDHPNGYPEDRDLYVEDSGFNIALDEVAKILGGKKE